MSAFKNGDEVRIIKTGFTGTLRDVNPNPNYAADEEYWAEVGTGEEWESGTPVESPEEVVLVRVREDIPPRLLPTPKELVNSFSSALLSLFREEVSIDETDTNGEPDGHFLAYGTSSTGQRFACRVIITEIERTTF